MVKFEELEVGQTVEHTMGFTGEIVEIIGGVNSHTIKIKVTDSGTSNYAVGYRYGADADYITRIITPVPAKQKLVIDVEMNGIEDINAELVDMKDNMQGLLDITSEMAGLHKEESVFEAELGNGIKFKGTKSDFEVFVSGLSEMFQFAKNMGL